MATLTKGHTFASGDTVTATKLNDLVDSATISSIVNADISDGAITNAKVDAAASIAFSKLAALDSANILVGNSSNVATKVAVTGDVTISDTGVTTIGSAKVTPTMLAQPLTLATAQDTTSGANIDFTGIPSWAKRITVMFNGVSTNGSSVPIIQLGDSGGFETSGYTGLVANQGTSSAAYAYLSTGFSILQSTGSGVIMYGHVVIVSMGNNTWTAFGGVGRTDNGFLGQVQGAKTLSDTLTQIRLTTVNGTNTFDAGSVNIMYEG